MNTTARLAAISTLFLLASIVGCGASSKKGTDDTENGHAANGSKSKPYSGSSLSEWPKQFDEMTRLLDLTGAEQANLQSTFEEHTATVQDWYKKNGDALAELDRQAKAAVRDRDVPKLKRLARKKQPLYEEAMKLHHAMDMAILHVLPEQKQFEWEGHLLSARILKLMEPLNLRDPQKERIRQLGTHSAAKIKSNINRTAEGFIILEQDIERKVLTAAQKDAYEPIKKKNMMRSLTK